MSQERFNPAVSLFVENDKKQRTQEWVRSSIIPRLINRPVPPERALLALHYASTWDLSGKENWTAIQRCEVILRDGGFLQGKTGSESRKFIREVARGANPDIKVHLAPSKRRGKYRLLGQLEKKDGNQSTKVDFWRGRAIQIITREGDKAYICPSTKSRFAHARFMPKLRYTGERWK